jgi:hypothetical protein
MTSAGEPGRLGELPYPCPPTVHQQDEPQLAALRRQDDEVRLSAAAAVPRDLSSSGGDIHSTQATIGTEQQEEEEPPSPRRQQVGDHRPACWVPLIAIAAPTPLCGPPKQSAGV